MKQSETEVIKAVHYKDVARLFESLKLTKEFKNGEIRCTGCNTPITGENFQAVKKVDRGFLFCCENESCIAGFR